MAPDGADVTGVSWPIPAGSVSPQSSSGGRFGSSVALECAPALSDHRAFVLARLTASHRPEASRPLPLVALRHPDFPRRVALQCKTAIPQLIAPLAIELLSIFKRRYRGGGLIFFCSAGLLSSGFVYLWSTFLRDAVPAGFHLWSAGFYFYVSARVSVLISLGFQSVRFYFQSHPAREAGPRTCGGSGSAICCGGFGTRAKICCYKAVGVGLSASSAFFSSFFSDFALANVQLCVLFAPRMAPSL